LCIVCHYKGDNQLITTEQRMQAHPDGFYRCIRPFGAHQYTCIDCREVVSDRNHVCDTLPVARKTKPGKKSPNQGLRGAALKEHFRAKFNQANGVV
jgi:hypothetical protein